MAKRGHEVVVAADSPSAVLDWLERQGESADAMFLVESDGAKKTKKRR